MREDKNEDDILREKDITEPDPNPTEAGPGSCGKMLVFQYRLLNGYSLHHPEDEKTQLKEISERELLYRGMTFAHLQAERVLREKLVRRAYRPTHHKLRQTPPNETNNDSE